MCGTLQGLLAHQGAGEDPCGYCLQGDAAARIAAEGIPGRPASPAPPQVPPGLAEEIRRHREELLAAVGMTGGRRAREARDDLAARRDARRGSDPARRAG